MAIDKIADRYIETDVLVIGAGLGGCSVAAKAKEHGLKVTLMEKTATIRSGSAGQGIDHFGVLFPREGLDALGLLKLHARWARGMNDSNVINMGLIYNLMVRAPWVFDELDKLGVTVRWDDGEPNFLPWPRLGFPIKRVSLRVHWQNVKPELYKAVRERGVDVLDRTMLVDLLKDKNAVVGATAYNVRNGEFIVVKAKAVVLATGWVSRIYDPENPSTGKYKFRYHVCPAGGSGDSWGAVFRAGGELANMDINTWTPRIRDDLTISYGNFRLNDGVPMRCLTWDGEEIVNPGPQAYAELERTGKTPIYYSLENLNDIYHKRIEVAYSDERPISFKIGQDRGFNPRKHRYEINHKPLGFTHWNGIFVDENGKTSLDNLYAAGDCAASTLGCALATATGLMIGENMEEDIKNVEPVIDEDQVAAQKEAALRPLYENDGCEPIEFEVALRYLCERYVSYLRSEGKLREGLRRLNTLKRVWLPKLQATNPHYMMRALECRNLVDVAQLHIEACLERKETRAGYVRLDYPELDPKLTDKVNFQKLQNGQIVQEFREMPKFKYSDEVK